MGKKGQRGDRQGGQRPEATEGHQGGTWSVPKPCGEGHSQLSPPASLSASQAAQDPVGTGVPREAGGVLAPSQALDKALGTKACGMGRHLLARGICLAREEVEGGEETAFQSVSPFVNPSKPPQCLPHGSSYSRVPTCPL